MHCSLLLFYLGTRKETRKDPDVCQVKENSSDLCSTPKTKRKSASDSNLNKLNDNTLEPQSSHTQASDHTTEHIEPLFCSTNKTSTSLKCPLEELTIDEPLSSPTIPDSLNSSVVESDIDLKASSKKSTTPVLSNTAFLERERKQCFIKSNEEHPYYTSVEDSDASTVDSLDDSLSYTKQQPQCDDLKQVVDSSKQKVIGILKKNRCWYGTTGHNASSDTLDQHQLITKSQKKVRFSDEVIIDEKNSTPTVVNITDSVQIELWKKVFPKEFIPHSIPNSAFTPKMKCSLSSNVATAQSNPPAIKQYALPSDINTVSVPVSAVAVESATTGTSNSDIALNQNIEVKDLSDIPDEMGSVQGSSQAMEKTPTDSDINSMWDQIRQCLQDDRKVSVPPRVFNFKPPTENRRALTDNSRTATPATTLPNAPVKLLSTQHPVGRKNNMNYTTRKQLVYRQPNQSRLMSEMQPHPPLTAQYPVPVVKHEQTMKDSLYPCIKSSSKEPKKPNSSYKGGQMKISN